MIRRWRSISDLQPGTRPWAFRLPDTGCTIRITATSLRPDRHPGKRGALTELEQQRASLPTTGPAREDSFASSSPSDRWTMA
jgi:hypothetical protein